eukprot:5730542-Amphidinium_carterae.1
MSGKNRVCKNRVFWTPKYDCVPPLGSITGPSEKNPADAPSRKHESSHVKKTASEFQPSDAHDS